jgi:hypothetical protein
MVFVRALRCLASGGLLEKSDLRRTAELLLNTALGAQDM